MPLTEQHRAIIVGARKLIIDPEHWTRFCLARTARNWDCKPDELIAVKFSAVGALVRACLQIGIPRPASDRRTVEICSDVRQLKGMNLSQINDEHGHVAVLRILDELSRVP